MKLKILSDIHIEAPNADIGESFLGDEDAIVCAGDISNDGITSIAWLQSKFVGKPVVFVPGNHEFYSGSCIDEISADMMEVATDSGINLLQNAFTDYDDVRFIGSTLWSDFQIYKALYSQSDVMRKSEQWVNDFEFIHSYRNRKLSSDDVRRLNSAATRFLAMAIDQARRDKMKIVVVTHFAPHMNSIAPQFAGDIITPYFVNDLSKLMPGVSLWIHGHTHAAFDYTVGATRVICNPGGYRREKSGFNPNLIVEI